MRQVPLYNFAREGKRLYSGNRAPPGEQSKVKVNYLQKGTIPHEQYRCIFIIGPFETNSPPVW